MTEKEIGELYTRLAFQYESSIDSLLARQIIDTNLAKLEDMGNFFIFKENHLTK